jgi:hypothetical protein
MNQNLDFAIQTWLEQFSKKWDLSVDEIADNIAKKEINNRVFNYRELKKVLTNSELDLKQFKDVASKCNALSFPQDIIRLNHFIKNPLC